ncbi:hypothetical protein BEP19_15195 [Ammoniphilus oxalaticus]|uniref:Phosphatidic acid phosphatase type 2/haloperoxidase domain-containing protein n=1 Tax=Ammoniphilus oxalaticus TaxID=66863 RepID=A0A419SD54_9BACL|nr:phosphatase PAP2 family protein [Ammoniphilus oxalaticus]RKD21025.1 hypothetical protein BEP19_15195 [Ammoniphilus oxalaticus]
MLDTLMIFFSEIGNGGAVWFLLVGLLLLFKSSRKAGIYTAVAILTAALVQYVLKILFARPRPLVDPIDLLIEMPTSYSFPSGHTLISFSAAAALALFFPRMGGVALVIALIIGISRVYLRVHFVSDVFFGALFGLAISYGLARLKKWDEARRGTVL